MWPVIQSEDLPVPHLPTDLNIEDDDEEDTSVQDNEVNNPIFEASITSCESCLLTQGKLNIFVHALKLSTI